MVFCLNQYVNYQNELWVIIAIKENGDLLISRYESYNDGTDEIIKRIKPAELE